MSDFKQNAVRDSAPKARWLKRFRPSGAAQSAALLWIGLSLIAAACDSARPGTSGGTDAAVADAVQTTDIAADAGTDVASGSAEPIDLFAEAWVAAACASHAVCHAWIEHFATPEGCKAWMARRPSAAFWVSGVKAGKVTFHADAAETCLKNLNTICYADLEHASAAFCPLAFSGSAADGSACQTGAECKSGTCTESGADCSVCAPAKNGNELCDGGKCPPIHSSGAGAACVFSIECKQGLFCSPVPGSGGFGEPTTCTPTGPPDSKCSMNEECNQGLVCLRDKPNDPAAHCGTPLVTGSACFTFGNPYDEACAPTDSCIDGTCLPLRKVGEACSKHAQCGLDAWCPAGKCAVVPATVGESCAPGPTLGVQRLQCGGGLHCSAKSICVSKSGADTDCNADSDCLDGLSCSGSSQRKCMVPATAGKTCSQTDGPSCEEGLLCGDKGVCAAPKCP